MRIIQVVDGYKNGNGVSNVVAAIDGILQRNNYETFICSRQLTFEDIESELFTVGTIVFYHFSLLMDPIIKYLKCSKVLLFHNITEPELLVGADEENRIRCSAGLYDAMKTSEYFDYAVTFSEYSRRCLAAMGWQTEKISVLPIPVRLNHFAMEPSREIIQRYGRSGINILFTGRVRPHKKQEDIIAAFAAYKELYQKNARLFLVGSISRGNYYPSLCAYAKKLGISEDVLFTGHISFEEYLAYYHIADVYVCMSEHEGFCIPLVEAMYFEKPIIAYASTAVPDTLAGSGILLDSKEPKAIARVINEVMVNKNYRQAVVDGQNVRLKQLRPELIENQFADLINGIAGSLKIKENIQEARENNSYRFSLINDLFAQIGSQVEKTEQYVIYGAGAVGERLYIELNRKGKNKVVLCDSFRGGEFNPRLNCTVISPKEAVKTYKKSYFIVSVQEKRAILEIVVYLLEQGIEKEYILLYDNLANQII